jgi:hypothetical protein
MGQALGPRHADATTYAQAWREPGSRRRVKGRSASSWTSGTALGRHTRKPLRASLRLMRGPAQAAGLGALQAFLETGFYAFRQLPDLAGFLAVVAGRERELAASAVRRRVRAAGPARPRVSLGALPCEPVHLTARTHVIPWNDPRSRTTPPVSLRRCTRTPARRCPS